MGKKLISAVASILLAITVALLASQHELRNAALLRASREVWIGDSREAVRAALGEPDSSATVALGGTEVETWTYRRRPPLHVALRALVEARFRITPSVPQERLLEVEFGSAEGGAVTVSRYRP